MQWDAMRSIALAGSRKSPLPVELEIADENFPLAARSPHWIAARMAL